jgi:transposase
VWLATGHTDLRRGFNGLHALIVHQFGQAALTGDIFVFTNRRRDLLKVFFFETGGIWICAKRLEQGTFRWPKPQEHLVTLTTAELQLLLSGIDLRQTRRRRWWQPAASAPTPTGTVPRCAGPDDPTAGSTDRSGRPRDPRPLAGSFPPP